MAQRTDTKALDQANGVTVTQSKVSTSDHKAIHKVLLQACQDISILAGGGDDYMIEKISGQLCNAADFLTPWEHQKALTTLYEVLAQEDAVSKDVAGAEQKLEVARQKDSEQSELYWELQRLTDASRESYKANTGKVWVPRPPKTATVRKTHKPTAAERLASRK